MAYANDFNTQVVPLALFADNPLRLAPEDHPNGYWSETHGNYNQWWAHYKGYTLNKKANGLDLYPVKLNLVRPAVLNHAALLLGQFSDRIVRFGVSNAFGVDEALSRTVTRDLNLQWHVNSGDMLLLEQALYQQIFGGMVWNVAWTPNRKRWPIRYFSVDPRAVFPVWDGNDYNRLVAVDVFHQVPRPTAIARYGVNPVLGRDREFVTIKEHWDENEFEITVDGEVGQWSDGAKMAGPNPFEDPVLGVKVIPYVYAPRIRVGEFEGESLVPGLIGGLKELNNNLAHLNEGLADSMQQHRWVRGRTKGSQGLDQPRNAWLDLGLGQPGNPVEPEVGRLPGAELTEPMIDLMANKLPELIRENTNLPNVSYGRTEASVRRPVRAGPEDRPAPVRRDQDHRPGNGHAPDGELAPNQGTPGRPGGRPAQVAGIKKPPELSGGFITYRANAGDNNQSKDLLNFFLLAPGEIVTAGGRRSILALHCLNPVGQGCLPVVFNGVHHLLQAQLAHFL